jgi:hypothetical protein
MLFQQCRTSVGVVSHRLLMGGCVVCWLLAGPAWGAGKDDYLSEIEAESEKINRGGVGEGTAPAAASTGEGFSAGLSSEAFAEELKARYSGTHAFFAKLPPEIQTEVYRDYLDGASYEEVREKIMKRFLHR